MMTIVHLMRNAAMVFPKVHDVALTRSASAKQLIATKKQLSCTDSPPAYGSSIKYLQPYNQGTPNVRTLSSLSRDMD